MTLTPEEARKLLDYIIFLENSCRKDRQKDQGEKWNTCKRGIDYLIEVAHDSEWLPATGNGKTAKATVKAARLIELNVTFIDDE